MIEAWKAHIEDSIAKALRHESYIDKEILEIRGFSTGVMRRLISNLCRFEKENLTYLEVGLYGGATLCAAFNNNSKLIGCGVEDYSQKFEDEGIFEHLKQNLEKFVPHEQAQIFNVDFFKKVPASSRPVDIFFYDGEHSYESQYKALPHALPVLANEFVFIVDDYDWKDVWSSTGNVLAEMDAEGKISVVESWELTDDIPDGPNWHNGVAIFLCKKT